MRNPIFQSKWWITLGITIGILAALVALFIVEMYVNTALGAPVI